jgi:hypothetical protein
MSILSLFYFHVHELGDGECIAYVGPGKVTVTAAVESQIWKTHETLTSKEEGSDFVT